ncbi:unnamed protein product [Clavelina lepadiformis]|uniref:CUB domain-containing protein n=1 Tax=Clavelina lepadiformis TaxID=159417 RepID=A0ABP0F595_CLALP
MVQKSLAEKVKLLTKLNEEKNEDASLTVWQLAALVGISKSTLQDWQKNDANLREQREETMLRGRGLKRKRLRILRWKSFNAYWFSLVLRNTECERRIKTRRNAKIVIKFEDFETKKGNDYVEVRNDYVETGFTGGCCYRMSEDD